MTVRVARLPPLPTPKDARIVGDPELEKTLLVVVGDGALCVEFERADDGAWVAGRVLTGARGLPIDGALLHDVMVIAVGLVERAAREALGEKLPLRCPECRRLLAAPDAAQVVECGPKHLVAWAVDGELLKSWV